MVELLPFGLRFLGIGYVLSSYLALAIGLMCPWVLGSFSSKEVCLMNCSGEAVVLVVVLVLPGFSERTEFVGSFIGVGWLPRCFS